MAMRLHYSDDVRKIIGKPGFVKRSYNWLFATEEFFSVKRWHLLLAFVVIVFYTAIVAWFY